jgi:hypothetical protein
MMGIKDFGYATATVLLWVILSIPILPQRSDALAGCCVCNDCAGNTQICDEQQTGSAQCDDFCEAQGCDDDGTFNGGVMDTCATGCDGDFGGGGQTPVPTATPTHTPLHTATPTVTETEVPRELICNDGVDNDMDTDIDCDDSDCIGMSECTSPAPAVSPPQMLLLAVLLAMGGLVILARRNTRSGHGV